MSNPAFHPASSDRRGVVHVTVNSTVPWTARGLIFRKSVLRNTPHVFRLVGLGRPLVQLHFSLLRILPAQPVSNQLDSSSQRFAEADWKDVHLGRFPFRRTKMHEHSTWTRGLASLGPHLSATVVQAVLNLCDSGCTTVIMMESGDGPSLRSWSRPMRYHSVYFGFLHCCGKFRRGENRQAPKRDCSHSRTERFYFPKVLFQGCFLHKHTNVIQNTSFQSLMKCGLRS